MRTPDTGLISIVVSPCSVFPLPHPIGHLLPDFNLSEIELSEFCTFISARKSRTTPAHTAEYRQKCGNL
jgi:hypothetical protein